MPETYELNKRGLHQMFTISAIKDRVEATYLFEALPDSILAGTLTDLSGQTVHYEVRDNQLVICEWEDTYSEQELQHSTDFFVIGYHVALAAAQRELRGISLQDEEFLEDVLYIAICKSASLHTRSPLVAHFVFPFTQMYALLKECVAYSPKLMEFLEADTLTLHGLYCSMATPGIATEVLLTLHATKELIYMSHNAGASLEVLGTREKYPTVMSAHINTLDCTNGSFQLPNAEILLLSGEFPIYREWLEWLKRGDIGPFHSTVQRGGVS